MTQVPIESMDKRVNFTVKTFIVILFFTASTVASITSGYFIIKSNQDALIVITDELDHWKDDIQHDIDTMKDDDVTRFQDVKDAAAEFEEEIKAHIDTEVSGVNGRLDRITGRNAEDIEFLRAKH